MESILTSIKKLLGIAADDKTFDPDVIIHINTVFMTLHQIGVGPSTGFYIDDDTAQWTDFITDLSKLQAVKTYVFLKVKLLFDPASVGSSTLASYERTIAELEWRLNWIAETNELDETTDDSQNGATSDPDAGVVYDYTQLQNLPSINGETLIGNYNEKDPTVKKHTATVSDNVLVVE